MLSTRRKSCKTCVRSKRRCDLILPACGRCIARRVDCEYPWAALDNIANQDHQGFSWDIETFGSMTDLLSNTTDAIPFIPQSHSPAIATLLGDLISSRDNVSINLNFPIVESTSGTSQHVQSRDAEWGSATTGSKFQARTEYLGRRIATQPLALAQSGRTTFIHHTQVLNSAVLQDAMAASALHAMRNTVNGGIVKAEIARRAALLIDAVERVLVHSSTVELDLLPPVQALLIYQCIRLFSTFDITQQAQGEQDSTYLSSWADSLRQNIRPFDHTMCWSEWVRQESIRRTVLFVEMVTAVYTFLKLGWDAGETKVAALGFTAQAALWEANSVAEWSQACTKSERFELTLSTFGKDTENAKPDDFEELGMMIRATFTGLEAFEEWLGGDRKTLGRWGLRENRMLPAYQNTSHGSE